MKLKKRIILSLIGITVLFSLSGCSAFLAGASTIGVGMDTIRLERHTDFDTAWAAAIESLHELSAEIKTEDKDQNIIKATFRDNKLKILIHESLNEDSVLIDVSARKKGLPKLSLAENIVEQINSKLRKQNILK